MLEKVLLFLIITSVLTQPSFDNIGVDIQSPEGKQILQGKKDKAKESQITDKAKEDKAKEDKAKEDKAKEDKAKQDKAKEDKAKEDKAKEDKAKEDKAKEDKAKEDKAKEDKKKIDEKKKDSKDNSDKKQSKQTDQTSKKISIFPEYRNYRYTVSAYFKKDKANTEEYGVSFSHYTTSCSYKKCYVGWISYLKTQRNRIQGYPRAKGIRPMFLFWVNSEQDYSIVLPKKLRMSWKKTIFEICAKFNPYQRGNGNLKSEDVADGQLEELKLENFETNLAEVVKSTDFENSDYIQDSVENSAIELNSPNLEFNVGFLRNMIHIETVSDNEGVIRAIANQLRLNRKLLRIYSSKLIAKIIKIQKLKPKTPKTDFLKSPEFVGVPFPNQHRIKVQFDDFDENSPSRNLQVAPISPRILQAPKQIASSLLSKEQRTVYSTMVMGRKIQVILNAECYYYIMNPGPNEIGCSATIFYTVLNQKKMVEVYNYRRPYTSMFRYNHQIKQEWPITLQQIFPEMGYAKLRVVAKVNYRIAFENIFKIVQIKPFTLVVQNNIQSEAQIIAGTELNLSTRLLIGVAFKGTLNKAKIQILTTLLYNAQKNINYSNKYKSEVQPTFGEFARYKKQLTIFKRKNWLGMTIRRWENWVYHQLARQITHIDKEYKEHQNAAVLIL